MKKIIIFFFFINIFCFSHLKTVAFLDWDLWIDLYKKIDKWSYTLKYKLDQKESIKRSNTEHIDKLNLMAVAKGVIPCFKTNSWSDLNIIQIKSELENIKSSWKSVNNLDISYILQDYFKDSSDFDNNSWNAEQLKIDIKNKENEIKQKENEKNLNNIQEIEAEIKILNNELIKLKSQLNRDNWYCKKDWVININIIPYYRNLIIEYIESKNQKVINKEREISRISRIWLYSDWITENSSFDLIEDLKEIDKIIYTQELVYNWVNTQNLDALIHKLSKWVPSHEAKAKSDNEVIDPIDNNEYLEIDNNNWKDPDNEKEYNWENNEKDIKESIIWSYICDNSENKSWLDLETIKKLKDIANSWDIKEVKSKRYLDKQIKTSWMLVEDNFTKQEYISRPSFNKYDWYQEKKDKYPCNEFFCINVEFIMNSQNLFAWWKTRSIEAVLEKSNKHLKKYANTSLIPAKQTTNNFELWLKKLNLADTFHVWFVIQKKSPPILNIDNTETPKEESKKADGLSEESINFLDNYYDNLWLNYENSNNLDILLKLSEDQKNLISSAEANIDEVNNKTEKLSELISKKSIKNNILKDINFRNTSNSDLNDFNSQFIELEKFIEAIYEYVSATDTIIKWMQKIPIWWS